MKARPFYVGQIAGTRFHKISIGLKVNDSLTLTLDPDNQYDPNAIRVSSKAGQVGFIARKDTERFHKWLAEAPGRTLAQLNCRVSPSWDHITVELS